MFENRPLTLSEKEKLHPNYKKIIYHYENTTDKRFTSEELIVLKLLVEITTPAVINKMITRFHKQYPKNFESLHYIYPPVKNMFKNKKRSAT